MATRQSTTLRSRGIHLSLETSSSVTTLIDFSSRVVDCSLDNNKQQSDDTTMADTDKVSTNQLNDRTASITFDATALNQKYVEDWDDNDDFEPKFEYGSQGNAAGKPKKSGQLSLMSVSESGAVGQAQTLTVQCQIHDHATGTF